MMQPDHASEPSRTRITISPEDLAQAVPPENGPTESMAEPAAETSPPSRQPADMTWRSTAVAVGILLVAVTLLAWTASAIVTWALAPPVDNNLEAYLLLAQAAKSGRFDVAKDCADRAYSLATDPELRRMADVVSRMTDCCLRCGWRTCEEADSPSGLIKGILTGVFRPDLAVEACGITLDVLATDWQGIDQRYNFRHQQVMQVRRRSKVAGFVTFWALLISGAIAVAVYRDRIRDCVKRLFHSSTRGSVSAFHGGGCV